ncbi:iron-sulfur cluster carrier protein [Mameliella alba]|uniref:Iron-sulfur cluster carrier protein n=1 Tax=Mameliella alba TaxID=561184 RepID=A0A0B3S5E1_9RHOB|nr:MULTISPECIES: Mrp/NBP35 family ATP-binding protein [Mameliella]MBV6636857.1 Mrp/NBP35 family ATP-binding protein [Mameliella sp.]MCR9273549.1 Mrp/NBP35 family ATP-binding protein [Paracoccaceae bacterium]KHQ54228.1 Sodium:proton antiporter [Mameliella alba]OWV55019.1 MRP family ATP-binding protein [Mameliella alba]BBU57265.1 iron-sulfur cluster carrier protein [Mameliella alba]
MSEMKDAVEAALERVDLPDGGNLISRDMIRALRVENGVVRFVIEAPSAELARQMEPLRAIAQKATEAVPGVTSASVVLSAPTESKAPPQLKMGGHPKPQDSVMKPAGVKTILAVGSGKGGVGKSTVSANLAVALARAGKRVGLLDADIHGPSQPRMFGLTDKPASPDGKTIIPLKAHGVTVMSIGSMLAEDKAVVWRGPMLMGALQQMLMQVDWGTQDVLIVDLPPGTGDVQLSLCQKSEVAGAIVVSTPQDVALLDARKALDAFATLKTPVLGLIENMAVFTCPHCGKDSHIFGHGGVVAEAEKIGVPLLAQLPIDLDTRLGGDGGTPVAMGDGPISQAYAQLAERLIQGGIV